jgi:hypothetical protein
MSGFNVNTKTTTFSEVYDHFSTQPRSKKTDDDSSLRLKGTDLHVKSGTPSGVGGKAKTKRAQKKTDALNFVEKSLTREFAKLAMPDGGATDAGVLLKNLRTQNQISSDRVTLRDLDTIRNLSVNEQSLIKGLDKRLSKVSGTGAELVTKLRREGVIPKGSITVGDISKINVKVDQEIAVRRYLMANTLKEMDPVISGLAKVMDLPASQQKLETASRTATANIDQFSREGLAGLGKAAHQSTQWSISDGGKGGVIFAKAADNTKSVLKFDGGNTEIAEGAYKILDGMRKAIGNDPLPFITPNMTVINLATDTSGLQQLVNTKVDSEIQRLKTEINTARQANDQGKVDKLQVKLEKLEGGGTIPGMKQNLQSAPKVCKFEMIEGAKQANQLGPMDKLALVRSEQFARNLGKSMVIMQFLGFNDHLNMGDKGMGDNATNFSNLMINREGHIHLIDPAMHHEVQGNGSLLLGSTTQDQQTRFQAATDLLKRVSSGPHEIAAELDTIFTAKKMFTSDDRSLNNIAEALFGSTGEGAPLFYADKETNEGKYLDALDDKTKKRFMADLMEGMLQGLQLLDQHRAGISSSVQQTGVTKYDPKAILDSIHTDLSGLNLQAIRTSIQQYKAQLV